MRGLAFFLDLFRLLLLAYMSACTVCVRACASLSVTTYSLGETHGRLCVSRGLVCVCVYGTARPGVGREGGRARWCGLSTLLKALGSRPHQSPTLTNTLPEELRGLFIESSYVVRGQLPQPNRLAGPGMPLRIAGERFQALFKVGFPPSGGPESLGPTQTKTLVTMLSATIVAVPRTFVRSHDLAPRFL